MVKAFLALNQEALEAYRERRFGYVCFQHLLRSAQQLVNDGEIPSTPIERNTMGVACDVTMLERLVRHSHAKRKAAKGRRNIAIREMILSSATVS